MANNYQSQPTYPSQSSTTGNVSGRSMTWLWVVLAIIALGIVYAVYSANYSSTMSAADQGNRSNANPIVSGSSTTTNGNASPTTTQTNSNNQP